jgi:DNA end-binding protein Ku
MKAMFKGYIEMGLWQIPEVGGYSAIESGEKVSFNQLHCKCHNRIQYKYFCPTCNAEILDKKSEVIKGYEITKGNYIVLSESEIEGCKKDSDSKIKIVQFIGSNEIPEIFYESALFLSADKNGADSFCLLHSLLKELDKSALAKLVLRNKDHFLNIKPYNGILIAYDLHFPSEIRDTKGIEIKKSNSFDQDTMELAKQLILKMTKPFNPDEIVDEYTLGLREIISAKAEGRIIDIPKPQERKVLNLQDALKESLKQAVNF